MVLRIPVENMRCNDVDHGLVVVREHDGGVMQAVGDEQNDSPVARAGHGRLQGFEESEASPEREHFPLRRRRLPVLPVKQIAEHPGCGRCRAARRQDPERPLASGSALSARTLPAGSRAGHTLCGQSPEPEPPGVDSAESMCRVPSAGAIVAAVGVGACATSADVCAMIFGGARGCGRAQMMARRWTESEDTAGCAACIY